MKTLGLLCIVLSVWPVFFTPIVFAAKGAIPRNRHPTLQPRTLAMGEAGVGLADDEYAIFNNVAGLAGNKKKEFKLIGLGIAGSYDVYKSYADASSVFSNFSISSLATLSGKNIYGRGSATPILQLEQFAIAYVVDAESSITQYNASNPDFDVSAMTTHGVQAGYGFKLKPSRNAKDEIRLGIAAKIMFRRGGFYRLGPADLVEASNSPTTYINTLMGEYGVGYGGDLGMQYIYNPTQKSQMSFGSTLTDVANTSFDSKEASMIPMNWSLGLGYKVDMDMLKVSVAADLRDLGARGSLAQKIHLGVSLGLPFLELQMGLNQMYITYGLSFDIWIARISFTSYEEELGYRFKQNPSRRYMVQFDFKLPM